MITCPYCLKELNKGGTYLREHLMAMHPDKLPGPHGPWRCICGEDCLTAEAGSEIAWHMSNLTPEQARHHVSLGQAGASFVRIKYPEDHKRNE